MSWVLRMYDDEGIEVGWMKTVEIGQVPEWDCPWEYRWEVTHPDPDAWNDVRGTLSFYRKPRKEVCETIEGGPDDPFDRFHDIRLIRLDKDGPQAYFEEIASIVERRDGVARTEIEFQNTSR